jgi:hypothetical protein
MRGAGEIAEREGISKHTLSISAPEGVSSLADSNMSNRPNTSDRSIQLGERRDKTYLSMFNRLHSEPVYFVYKHSSKVLPLHDQKQGIRTVSQSIIHTGHISSPSLLLQRQRIKTSEDAPP